MWWYNQSISLLHPDNSCNVLHKCAVKPPGDCRLPQLGLADAHGFSWKALLRSGL